MSAHVPTFFRFIALGTGAVIRMGVQNTEEANLPESVMGSIKWVQALSIGPIMGLLWGALCGLGGLGSGLIGGLSVFLSVELTFWLGADVQSFLLRFWLWRVGCMPAPWQWVAFLDDTVDQQLLCKPGGGYAFRHRLLQDHFASQFTNNLSNGRAGLGVLLVSAAFLCALLYMGGMFGGAFFVGYELFQINQYLAVFVGWFWVMLWLIPPIIWMLRDDKEHVQTDFLRDVW